MYECVCMSVCMSECMSVYVRVCGVWVYMLLCVNMYYNSYECGGR